MKKRNHEGFGASGSLGDTIKSMNQEQPENASVLDVVELERLKFLVEVVAERRRHS